MGSVEIVAYKSSHAVVFLCYMRNQVKVTMNIKMRYLAAITAGMLMVTNTAASDDEIYLAGAGGASCGKFIADKEDDKIFRDLYFFWAQGFLSGLNFRLLLNDTESAVEFSDYEAHKLWIENYCEENPLDIYALAVAKLWPEIRAKQGLDPDPLINPEN